MYASSRGFYKTFTSPLAYEHEVSFYRDCPWATPAVVKLLPESLTIVTEVGQPVGSTISGDGVEQLAWILSKLSQSGVHHRDVHPGNIVLVDGRVKLLDWETAIRHPGRSYDLCGPVDVPVPVQHGGLLPQWWESNDPGSIWSVWGVGIPEWAKQ